MRPSRRFFLVAMVAAAFAACDLNPQPLPPGSELEGPNAAGGADFGADSGAQTIADAAAPEPPSPNLDSDAASGGDAGDAGDGGDAGLGDAGDAEAG